MKLEQELVNLELSKKLKELGVKQESLFIWAIYKNGKARLRYSRVVWNQRVEYVIAAFTVAELGEMLPEYYARKLPQGDLRIGQFSQINPYWTANTEANARAKMRIYLIENKLI